MRSEQVFLAERYVENRFLLCHWVRIASRRFHKTGEPIQETISKVLALVTDQPPVDAEGRQRMPLLQATQSRVSVRVAAAAASSASQESARHVG